MKHFLNLNLVLTSLLFLHSECSVYAQHDSVDQLFIHQKCKPYDIDLPRIKHPKLPVNSLPFSQIKVVDCRLDTSRIGIVAQKDIIFDSSASKEINSYLTAAYVNPDARGELLISINKLWLYDTLYLNPQTMERLNEKVRIGRILYRSEAYLKTSNGYTPLTFLDTVVTCSYGVITFASQKMEEILDIFMNKVLSADLTMAAQKRKPVPYSRITSLNNNRSQYPLDTASTLKKGVYASFEEFRNNNPSVTNYQLEAGKKEFQELYVKDDQGKPYFSRSLWGYSDGVQAYMMMDGNLYPVFHVNNAYYVWGSKQYRVRTYKKLIPLLISPALVVGSGAGEPIAHSVSRRMNFFSLDITTGETY